MSQQNSHSHDHNYEIDEPLFQHYSVPAFFLLFLLLVWYIIFLYENQKEAKYALQTKPTANKHIAKQFDPISREHVQLRKFAMTTLAFPISYQHLETIYFKNEQRKEIVIKMRFSALDTLNTEITSCLRATYTFHGEEITPPHLCGSKILTSL